MVINTRSQMVMLGFTMLVVFAMLMNTATAQLTFVYAYDKYVDAALGHAIKASGNFYAEIDRVAVSYTHLTLPTN